MASEPCLLDVFAVVRIPQAPAHGRAAGRGAIPAMEAQPTSWRTILAMPLERLLHDDAAHGWRRGNEVSPGVLIGP